MPVFKYQAREQMGKVVTSTISAPDMRAAMRLLLDRKNTIVWIKPQNAAFLDGLASVGKPLSALMVLAVAAFIAYVLWQANHHH